MRGVTAFHRDPLQTREGGYIILVIRHHGDAICVTKLTVFVDQVIVEETTPIVHAAYDTMMIFLCVGDEIFVVVYDTARISPWCFGNKPRSQAEANQGGNEQRLDFVNHGRQYDELKDNKLTM